ncbi:transposase [Selenomonas ruminantium]|uniref:transposase n=1 Tax=Selenomonas ruminantium TaxID=971 RepID=UPI0009D7033A
MLNISLEPGIFRTNVNRLQIALLAYSILNLFYRLCLSQKWQFFRAYELRLRLMRIAGRLTKHVGSVSFRLCSTYPY